MEPPGFHGAARQTFGSGSLRTPDDPTFKKIHAEKKQKQRERDERERLNVDDTSSSSFGIPIHQVPISHGNKPPTYRNAIGKPSIPIHSGPQDPVFRPPGSGIRRGDENFRQGGFPSHRDNEFVPQENVIMEADILIDDRQNSGNAAECVTQCEEKEFFCPKTCICISSENRCGNKSFSSSLRSLDYAKFFGLDGQIDCGPDAEDEEECPNTEDMIKKLKLECESNTVSRHVMCPNTYICIKQDWLCGESLWKTVALQKVDNLMFSDGDDDCNDFTDETHCGAKTNCSDDQFECSNGLCLPLEWTCGNLGVDI